MAIKSNGNFSVCTVPSALQPTVGGLAFGRGNAKARTGDKLSNSRKTFREHTPRLTPNRLLAVRAFSSFHFSIQSFTATKLSPFALGNFLISSTIDLWKSI